MNETGLVERLDGRLATHIYPVGVTLEDQLRPFWPSVHVAVIDRDDGVQVVHCWQPPEARGGELQLYLEPAPGERWVCVSLDRHLQPTIMAHAGTLTELVWAVCAALEIGLCNRGVA